MVSRANDSLSLNLKNLKKKKSMVEGTRMFQMSESLKESQDAISQQHVVNTNVDQILTNLNPPKH